MAVDTLAVPLPSHSLHQYLDKLNNRGEAYHFDVEAVGSVHVQLRLMREGSADPLIVFLKPNGTWYAEHVIVVGEKE